MRFILLFLCLTLYQIGYNQTWTQKANFTSARFAASSFSVNGKGYICLGSDAQNYFNDLQEYDNITNTWQSKAQFPGALRRTAISFVIDSLAYVGLGWNNNGPSTYTDMYSYNPNQDTWTSIASYPGNGGRQSMAAAVLGKGYVVGGITNFQTPYSNQLWEYDPLINSWAQKVNFSGGSRAGGIMFGIDSLVYCGLGHNTIIDYQDLWAYNPILNTWTQMANFPGVGRLNANAFVVNGKAIVGGGYRLNNSNTTLNDYYEYDPSTNSWSSISAFTAGNRSVHSSFTIGSKGYICGGWGPNNNSYLNDLWEYSMITTTISERDIENNNVSIYPNPSNGLFKLEFPNFQENIHIRIFSVQGSVVLDQDVSFIKGISEIDLSEFDDGFYFYNIQIDKNAFSGKLIINK